MLMVKTWILNKRAMVILFYYTVAYHLSQKKWAQHMNKIWYYIIKHFKQQSPLTCLIATLITYH